MIGLLFGRVVGGVFYGPCAVLGYMAALCTICGCVRCFRCHLRDYACCKRCLRCLGVDQFDDFELVIFVHRAIFEHKDKLATVVRVRAGPHMVSTDPNSRGIFHQALHVTVEQGVSELEVDLCDAHGKALATLNFDTAQHLLKPEDLKPETLFSMKQKAKGVLNPKIMLTMVVSHESDEATGLLSSSAGAGDMGMLVAQQLRKAKEQGSFEGGGDEFTEIDVLQKACEGPLEIFEGLGKTKAVYATVQGPPTSRRWLFHVWPDQKASLAGAPKFEVNLLKVQSVQADPTRHHVFVIHYFDECRIRQTLTFRRVDRARDVWVEILLLLCRTAREAHKQNRKSQKTPGVSFRKPAAQST